MNTDTPDGNGHIVKDFDLALSRLRQHVLSMGNLVVEQVKAAADALLEGKVAAAERVIEREPRINDYDTAIEKEAFELLAQRAPMASDLRIIIALARAVFDLERAGDEARNIARALLAEPTLAGAVGEGMLGARLWTMAQLATRMMQSAVDGLENGDAAVAELVARLDRDLDSEFKAAMHELASPSPATGGGMPAASLIGTAFALKALERIGDHARNLAAHVVFLVRADDVRHRRQAGA